MSYDSNMTNLEFFLLNFGYFLDASGGLGG